MSWKHRNNNVDIDLFDIASTHFKAVAYPLLQVEIDQWHPQPTIGDYHRFLNHILYLENAKRCAWKSFDAVQCHSIQNEYILKRALDSIFKFSEMLHPDFENTETIAKTTIGPSTQLWTAWASDQISKNGEISLVAIILFEHLFRHFIAHNIQLYWRQASIKCRVFDTYAKPSIFGIRHLMEGLAYPKRVAYFQEAFVESLDEATHLANQVLREAGPPRDVTGCSYTDWPDWILLSKKEISQALSVTGSIFACDPAHRKFGR